MERNKSQQLWYLLNRYDRENESVAQDIIQDQDQYPFFYLLGWNTNQGFNQLSKTALRSPIRSQFHSIHHDAPEMLTAHPVNSTQADLINDFLEKLPSLGKPKKPTSQEENLPLEDLADSTWTPPISETFAIILVKQGKYQQAIEIYEKLILAKPEKRLYFATRISDLQQNITE